MTGPRLPRGLQDAFEEVITHMGSVRIQAFDRLRERSELEGFRPELDELAGLDKESTQFESAMRDLQRRVYDDTR